MNIKSVEKFVPSIIVQQFSIKYISIIYQRGLL